MLEKNQLTHLTDKWAPILDSGDGISDVGLRETTSILLENQARSILNEQSKSGVLNESTTVGQLGTFQKFAFPIVRRVFPELLANKVVGVQPMQGPVSQVFYMGYDRNQANGDGAHENIYGKYNLTYGGRFPGDDDHPTATYGGLDVSTPAASSISASGTWNPSSTVGGKIAMYPDSENMLQYLTSAGEALGERLVSSHDGNNVLLQNESIPELDFHIETQSVEAGTRKFRALWTIEASQDLKAYHNLDLERELTELLSKEVELEIDRELIEDLRMIAYDVANAKGGFDRRNLNLPGANNFTGLYKDGAAAGTGDHMYDQMAGMATDPAGSDKNVFFVDFGSTAMPDAPQHVGHIYSNLLAVLNFASNDIYKTTLRGAGNWFICSPLVASMLESASKLEGGIESGAYTNGVSHKGKFAGKYDVYVDPLFPEDEILMGYKGSGPMDSGFIYSPYIPLQMLPTVTDPDTFQPRKGLITRYGKVAVSPASRFYRVIKVIGADSSKYLYNPFAKIAQRSGAYDF